MSTVDGLRRQGYKVRVTHMRVSRYDADAELVPQRRLKESCEAVWEDSYGETVSPTGGRTVVKITSPDGLVAEAQADCSKKDSYNKKLGVQIALGRALKQLTRATELRADISSASEKECDG